MSLVAALLAGILGLFAGSLIWIVAKWQASQQTTRIGPSCAACHTPLPATAWLPFYAGGTTRRCSACGAFQGWTRPVFELAVGAYYALAFATQDNTLDVVILLILAMPLLLIALVDLWTRLIYTTVTIAGLLVGLALSAVDGLSALGDSFRGLAAAVAILGAFILLSRFIFPIPRVVPLGPGDLLLAAMIGSMVRWPLVITSLFFGGLLAGVIGLTLVLTRGSRPSLPYGAFLCIGALVTLAARF